MASVPLLLSSACKSTAQEPAAAGHAGHPAQLVVRDGSVHYIHREAVGLGVGFDAGDEGRGKIAQLAYAHAVYL